MSNFSKTNKELAKFIAMKARISRLEKECDEIKSSLIAKGSFTTDKFTVDIVPVTQNRTISADQLCVVLDPVTVAKYNLINTSTYKKVVVKPLEAKSKAS